MDADTIFGTTQAAIWPTVASTNSTSQ